MISHRSCSTTQPYTLITFPAAEEREAVEMRDGVLDRRAGIGDSGRAERGAGVLDREAVFGALKLLSDAGVLKG